MTGFEPLIGAATAGLAGLISSLVKEKGSDVFKRLDLDIGKNLAFRNALAKYVQRYINRHGTLKVVCVRMDEAVKLDEIYTTVQLLERKDSRYYESTDSLQELFQKSGQRNLALTTTEKQIGIQVANEQQYLMVLGGPGVGKSTFLKKAGLEALRALGRRDFAQRDPENILIPQNVFYQHPCIPIMLELRRCNQPDLSIKDKIAEELETCGFPYPQEFTELLLKNGKLLVLLDGLDEVSSNTFNHVITEIEKLVDRYNDNRFIASCRIAAYIFGDFKQFKDVAMAAFDDAQIEHFINNWFRKPRDLETETAQQCWKLLNSKDYRAAKELAQTPLLLALLCVVYDEYQNFPKKRHALYGEALDVLLRKWASEKRIQRDPIYKQLSTELELYLLSEIAYISFSEDQLFFSKPILVEQIRFFLVENLNAPGYLNAEQVLKEIEIQQGILVERARDTYSFSHLTFHEYLTAKYIVDNQKIDVLVRNHITDERWYEVFLLVTGLVPGKQDTDKLLMAMEQQAQTYLNNCKVLPTMIEWSTKLTQTFTKNKDLSAIRAYAVAKALGRGRNFARTRNRSSDRDRNLALASARNNAMNLAHLLKHEMSGARVRTLSAVHARELDFTRACTDEINCIGKYFYILGLMMCCKEAAVRISPQIWSDIESRMFTT